MEDKKLQQKNNINILLNEYFNIVVIVIVIIIFIFSYFLFLGPKLKLTTMLIEDNIVTQKRLYGEQERKLNELEIIQEVYSNILPSDLGKFNQILPSNYVRESLFGELEEIVVKQGFLLGSATIEPSEEEGLDPVEDLPDIEGRTLNPNVGKIKVVASIETIDYAGFKKLLKTLEASSRLFDIETVNFSQEKNSAQIEIITYYYKMPK
jgi:hypothetical protein